MKDKFVLPLVEPLYSSLHNQGAATAVLYENPSVKNYYFNQIFMLKCSTKFLSGFTTPELGVSKSSWAECPHIEKRRYNMEFLNGYVHYVIRNLLNAGYYVFFNGIDDFYMKGKSWYQKRHFDHDGLICGYDREKNAYLIYAYDENWVYRSFWVPKSAFDNGRKKAIHAKNSGAVYGLKPKAEIVAFSCETALKAIEEYLLPTVKKMSEGNFDVIYGNQVHGYLIRYIGMLYDGFIPYERMDTRIFRLLWEHKKVLHQTLMMIEKELSLAPHISENYATVVKEADTIRMLYASHRLKRRDSVLPIIQKKLGWIQEEEKILLKQLLNIVKEKTT